MVSDRIYDVVFRPWHYIEIVFAVFMLLAGIILVVLTTQGAPAMPGSVREVITHPISIGLFAAGYLFGGGSITYGKIRKKKKSVTWGLYAGFLIMLFTIIGTWLVNGLFPLSWISLSVICLSCAILWLRAKWEEKI